MVVWEGGWKVKIGKGKVIALWMKKIMLTGDHSMSGSGRIVEFIMRTTQIDKETAKKKY